VFDLSYLLDGVAITILLVVALRLIAKLIHKHPEIKESHSMMVNHLIFFILNELAILTDAIFKICFKHNLVNLSWENGTMVLIILNLVSLCTEMALNFYIVYLMIKLCRPEDLAKQ